MDGVEYIEATDRLFGSLCPTLRHLALDDHSRNISAWEPLLKISRSLLALRIFNLREEWLPVLRRLDLHSLVLLHLDVLNPREAPQAEQAHAREILDILVESCLDITKEAIEEGRFSHLKTYVGGVTNDRDYPQRCTRIPVKSKTSSASPVIRVVNAFTRRDEWDPLSDHPRFEVLES
jgi:hypothetical protein